MATWLSAAALLVHGAACCALAAALAAAREPIHALNALAASMPEGRERLAGTPRGLPGSQAPHPDVAAWPADGLRAVRLSLARSSSPSLVDVRLAAAVDFFRGECAAAGAALEAALRVRRGSAQLLNDAAAAHACAARRSTDDAGLDAMRAFDRALAASAARPNWAEPWINIAAACETLGLSGCVRDALQRARGVERDAHRAAILDRRLERLSAATSASTDSSADTTDHGRLTRWAERAERGESTATEEAMLAAEGRRRAEANGDLFIADVARRLRDTSRRAQLAAGHLAYARGRTLYDAGSRERAGEEFKQARALFASADSPFEVDARLQHAIVLYQIRMLPEAARELDGVLSAARARRYRRLAARTNWIAALVHMQRGLIDRAAVSHLAALEEYEALGEIDNVAAVANSAADTMRVAGDNRRGWPMLVRAARAIPLASAQRRYLVLFNLSLYAQDEGLLRAAEFFQDAAVVEADRRGNPLTMVESRLRRGQLRVRRTDLEGARHDLAAAGEAMKGVHSSASAAYLAAWRDRIGTEIDAPRFPSSASARFERLTREFERIEPAEVPGVYLAAGRAAARAGDSRRAEAQFRLGTAFVLERGQRVEQVEFRAAYLGAAWSLFHDLIGLQFTRDGMQSLSMAETARRALARRDPLRGTQPFHVPDLPPDTLVVYYSVLNDRVLSWTLSGSRVTSRAIEYAYEDLAADVDAYRQALVTPQRDARAGEVARHLYDRLLAPALGHPAPSVERLIVAADGPLADLPFATLPPSARDGRLIDRFEIVLAPRLPDTSLPAADASVPTVLALGYDGGGAGLPRLDNAEREASLIGRLYRHQTLLTGPGATADALRSAAPDYDVIHVAAHARANRLMPWESRLVLAPQDDKGDALTFEAIERWNLRKCRLVVLSACETAGASRTRGYGLLSLATPLLNAGARVVIGTLWPVDDRASAMFMELLHRRVAAGGAPAAALRAAQLEALRSDDPTLSAPSTWAAYVAIAR